MKVAKWGGERQVADEAKIDIYSRDLSIKIFLMEGLIISSNSFKA